MPTPETEHLLWPQLDRPDQLEELERVPLESRSLPTSTFAVVQRRATMAPDDPAVTFLPDCSRYDEGVTWSARELYENVCRYANALTKLDSTTPVALLSPNCRQLLASLLAAETASVALPLNPGLSLESLNALIRTAQARVLVASGPELDAGTWETAVRIAREGAIDTLLALRPDVARPPGAAPPLESVAGVQVAYLEDLARDLRSDTFLGWDPKPEDLASLFHTGGTTGTPKLAAHTQLNEVVIAWGIATSRRALPDDAVVLAGLPLFHVNALMVTVLAPLMHGQRVVWTGPYGYRDPMLYPNFWKIVEHYEVAAMSAVPTVYAVLAEIPIDADISSLKAAAVGAAPLPPTVRAAFEKHTGVPLIEGYGLTEAGCVSARTLPGFGREGSVGQRMPYQQVKAVKIDEASGSWIDLPPGAIGHLVVGGPAVFPGYARLSSSGTVIDSGGVLHDGFLNTGDLGYVDADGFVYLRGRAKDVIIRGGHNIDPAMIEEALLDHPAVSAAAAVGQPDPHSGEVPVAFVTTVSPTSSEELRAWAAERIPERAAVPREIYLIDSIPLTLIGKPDKLSLRNQAVAHLVRIAIGDPAPTVSVHSDGGGSYIVTLGGISPAARDVFRQRLEPFPFVIEFD